METIKNILKLLACGPIHIKVDFRPYPAHWRTGQRPHESNGAFGAELRRQRMALHLLQADLAKAIGVATVTVSKWEVDITFPSRRMQKKLRDYFELRRNAFNHLAIQKPKLKGCEY